MIHQNVTDEDSFDYGEFSIGPFRLPDLERLDEALKACGLALPIAVCEDPVNIIQMVEGFTVEVKGEGVVGYLISTEDNMEAERSQLFSLGLALVRPGEHLSIGGMHQVNERVAIRVETTISRPVADPQMVEIEKTQSSLRIVPRAEDDSEFAMAI